MQERVATSQPLVIEDRDGGVALLRLNRPEARNALSRGLIAALDERIAVLGSESGVSVIVIGANGPVFSSGHDLREMTARRTDPDGGEAFFAATMKECSALMQAIVACPKPVIAAVEGTATAAGCQLVATCDLAVAADDAKFMTPGVNIGLFCSTPMVALSRNVPRKKAMEMLLLGEAMSARDAEHYGLINRAVPKAQVMSESLAFAKRIEAKSRETVKTGKVAFYRQIEQPLEEAYRYASEVMTRNMLDTDAEEGICAFLDKRPAVWSER